MKTQSILLTAMLVVATALAQAPQGINYQAIVRDAGGLTDNPFSRKSLSSISYFHITVASYFHT